MFVDLADFEYGEKLDIITLRKERGYTFSECCTKTFKEKLLREVNEVLFERVKTLKNDTYKGGTNPTSLQN